MTKKKIWIVSFLIKSGINDAEPAKGYRTAVSGRYLGEANFKANDFIRSEFETAIDKYFISNISLADQESEQHIGELMDDPFADEWPE